MAHVFRIIRFPLNFPRGSFKRNKRNKADSFRTLKLLPIDSLTTVAIK